MEGVREGPRRAFSLDGPAGGEDGHDGGNDVGIHDPGEVVTFASRIRDRCRSYSADDAGNLRGGEFHGAG
jgi:hypothetical protein